MKREELRKDLLEQLERNGTFGKYYADLVEDYLKFWDIKNALQKDIDERGAVVEYEAATGVKNFRKNESVTELIKTNDRMVKLLDAIGISPTQTDGDTDDEM